MNKKEIYDKKIEILRKFLNSDYDIDLLKQEQQKNKEILEPEYVKAKEEKSGKRK